MTSDEIKDYTTKAFPSFVESYRQLVQNGKLVRGSSGTSVFHNGEILIQK